METNLLKPRKLDLIFRYPPGRSLRLAKRGQLPYIVLPDGEIRFDQKDIEKILSQKKTMFCR